MAPDHVSASAPRAATEPPAAVKPAAARTPAISAREENDPDADFTAAVLKYKYSSPTLSVLERLYLNEFWGKVVNLYPMWLAPNLITLGGYACVWIAYLITITSSPDLKGTLTPGQYLACAALYFLYQTLDGSDGKQARRTGSGSALGELMDHGVDAVVTALLALLVADCFAFGIRSVWPWSFVLVAQLNFFLSNMTLVHSGRQMFFDLDVMEVQTVMIITLAITGALGSHVFSEWSLPLPTQLQGLQWDMFGLLHEGERVDWSSGRVPLRDFIVLNGLFGCCVNYPQYLWAAARPYVMLGESQRPPHVRERVTGTGVGALLFHVILAHVFSALSLAAVLGARAIADEERSASVLRALAVTLSFGFGDLMDRVLIMRVAREPLPLLPPGALVVTVFAALVWADAGAAPGAAAVLPQGWWWAVAATAAAVHHAFFAKSVRRLARALNIHPFKVRGAGKKE